MRATLHFAVLALAATVAAAQEPAAGPAEAVLRRAGISRGVACVPDCGTGELALDLARRTGLMVLAMDEDPAAVAAAKKRAAEDGLLGRSLYVELGSPGAIPFADNYVDLLALPALREADLTPELRAEIMRVLAPIRGRAVLADTVIAGYELSGSDWWTHKLHGPNNNQVSQDTVFQWPPILQYRAMPFHNAHTGSGLTSSGRHVEIHDWTLKNPERANLCGRLYVRSSYNGRLLWQGVIPEGIEANMPLFAATDDTLFMASGSNAHVLRRDLETGAERPDVVLGGEDRRVVWLAVADDVLYALLGSPAQVRSPFSFALQSSVFQEQEGRHTLFGSEIVAWNLVKGTRLWSHREEQPIDFRAVAVHDGKVYLYSEGAHLACLDAADGKPAWTNADRDWIAALKRPPRIRNHNIRNMSTLSVADGLVRLALIEAGGTSLFQASDGKLLATFPGGKWWSDQKAVIVDGTYHRGGSAIDLDTLAAAGTKLETPVGTAWCGIATYAPGVGLIGHSTLDYKSPCGVGAWVAGGILLYSPTVCGCGSMQGAGGFASGGALFARAESAPEHPLVKGPAWGQAPSAVEGSGWPAYRGDSRHRGSSPAKVRGAPAVQWTSAPGKPFDYTKLYNQFVEKLDERPTPPTVAAGLVFSAGSDGIVRALRLADGRAAWSFFADGPVLTSPAWEVGRLFIPCADGWVYALEAASGRLIWRRRLAPVERRIHVFDQFMSTWPVLSLAVEDGVVYAAAGMLKADGSKAFALAAETGEVVWERAIEPEVSGSHWPAQKRAFGYNGHTAVVGGHVWFGGYLSMPLTLDRKTGALPELSETFLTMRTQGYNAFKSIYYMQGKDVMVLDDRNVLVGGSHLLENQQLREGKRNRTAYRLYNLDERGAPDMDQPPPAILKVARIAPAADDELVAFVAPPPTRTANGQERDNYKMSQCTVGLNVWDKQAFTDAGRAMKTGPLIDEARSTERRLQFVGAGTVFRNFDYAGAMWQKPDLDVNAVVVAGDAVLAAHASGASYGSWNEARGAPRDALIAYEGWQLSAFAREDGAELWSAPLPSEPLQNGIALAPDGRIIVALRDGGLVCLAP